jgi:cellulose synthase (UDP-forming)
MATRPALATDVDDSAPAALEPLLDDRQERTLKGLVVACVLALTWFWSWWLQPEHWAAAAGMLFNSAMLAWATGLAGYLFFFALRATRPSTMTPLPAVRVAMVVTKAPSEPWPVVQRTIEAMLAQELAIPFDVWLADEQPSVETRRWCETHRVRVSSRHGLAAYHQASWPRRTRSKEGNLTYFYERHGYDDYDVVVQLDADHVPAPGYLDAMVRPFADPTVGYVAAPSVCDANRELGWTVTARLYKEATLHGVVQAGCNGGYGPVCIGSHYAVRTAAVRSIGGIGPELAEDFSTSFILQSRGWDGVFSIDAEAHGDGPESFTECMTQELQWSRSLATVAVRYTGGRWHKLPWRTRARFAFSLLFYPLFALQMLAGVLFPLVAIATDTPWVDVPLVGFWLHVWPVSLMSAVAVAWLRRQQVLRPVDTKLVSWEVTLFMLTRWWWVLWGTLQGWWAGWRRRDVPFRVTPKGSSDAKLLQVRFVAPTLVWPALIAVVLAVTDAGRTAGYRLLAVGSMLAYLIAANVVVALHLRDNRHRRRANPPATRRPAAAWLAQGGAALIATLAVTGTSVALVAWRARYG